jgi:tetratricopeptide (TPR) repeat protein
VSATVLFVSQVGGLNAYVLAAVMVDASFSNLYPDPWWKTSWGGALIGVGVALVTAAAIAFTVATAGAGGAMLGAAGSWITSVGSMVGMAAGYGSGAAAAGLAILGGGTVASGGFGMVGGAFVVAALTGVATGIVADLSLKAATELVINEPYKRYDFIKIPMLEKRGSKKIVDHVEELKELEIQLSEEKIEPQKFSSETKRISKEMQSYFRSHACRPRARKDKNKIYDSINAAILYFNLGRDKEAEKCIDFVSLHSENSSFLSYLTALNNLAENEYPDAFKDLDIALAREPEALQPYILYTMALSDQENYRKVLKIANDGLRNVSKSNFQLLYTAGEAAFQLKRYGEAAKYFKKAYSNVSEDFIEADTAMMVAISYHKDGDESEGWKWYEKALNKLGKKNDQYKREITKRWNKFIS